MRKRVQLMMQANLQKQKQMLRQKDKSTSSSIAELPAPVVPSQAQPTLSLGVDPAVRTVLHKLDILLRELMFFGAPTFAVSLE